MKPRTGRWLTQAFVFAFLVLTLLCWCPLGYGSYGPVARVLGVPSWAVMALVVGAVLFVVEWIYLFPTGLAMDDEELPDIIAQLKAVDTDNSNSGKPLPGKDTK